MLKLGEIMAKKKKKQNKIEKRSAGESFGSFLRLLYNIFVKYTGLWLVTIYSIIGLIIWLVKRDNPFLAFDSIPHIWFNIGFFATIFISLLITIKKLVINPMKSVSRGFKNPTWQKKKPEEEEPYEEQPECYYDEPERPTPPPQRSDLEKRKDGKRPTSKEVRHAIKARKKLAKETKKFANEIYESQPTHEPFGQGYIAPSDYANPYYNRHGQDSMFSRGPAQPYIEQAPASRYSNSPESPLPTHKSPMVEERVYTTYQQQVPYSSPEEEPKIYMSALEPDVLVHEYSDRFEVYKMVKGKAVRDRVEFKNK